VAAFAQGLAEGLQIQARFRGVPDQAFLIQRFLAGEQQVVHFPEFPLISSPKAPRKER
jgi:hypothetical protein